MGAAWLEPKDRDSDQVVRDGRGVKLSCLETCANARMLTSARRGVSSGQPSSTTNTTGQPRQPRRNITAPSSPGTDARLPGRLDTLATTRTATWFAVIHVCLLRGIVRHGAKWPMICKSHESSTLVGAHSCPAVPKRCRSISLFKVVRTHRWRAPDALDPIEFRAHLFAVGPHHHHAEVGVRLSAGRDDMARRRRRWCSGRSVSATFDLS